MSCHLGPRCCRCGSAADGSSDLLGQIRVSQPEPVFDRGRVVTHRVNSRQEGVDEAAAVPLLIFTPSNAVQHVVFPIRFAPSPEPALGERVRFHVSAPLGSNLYCSKNHRCTSSGVTVLLDQALRTLVRSSLRALTDHRRIRTRAVSLALRRRAPGRR
jgi:hypothetical protein